MTRSVHLPARSALAKTNDEDPLDYYYHPLTGPFYRQRLVLALNALGPGPFDSLLEVGYGSGILLPELARRCQKLYAVDIHEQIACVQKMLATEHISAELEVGDVLALDYAAHSFDAVVCLSVLEHMDEGTLPLSLREIHRVSKPGATIVLGFPVQNVITDFFYRLVGFSPRDLHPSSHRDIQRAAKDRFWQVEAIWWPRLLPMDLSLYMVCQCRP